MEDPQDTKSRLAKLLKSREGILMVGAGISKMAGFPLWSDLIEKMRAELTPDVVFTNENLIDRAEVIKQQLLSSGRSRQYVKFLEREFCPQDGRQIYTDFHAVLVQLGFSGIITTNYDIVLENTVKHVANNLNFHCEPIDLCASEHTYRVFGYLRSLSPYNDHNSILHLHGLYRNPQEIILSRSDFEEKYGEMRGQDNTGMILDTLHRKVIWALLTMRSLIFVGFSMNDPFFMRLLDIVHFDFQLDREATHFAIMSYRTEDERNRTYESLRSRGVVPVFYHVPATLPEVPEPNVHRGLIVLIDELASLAGTPTTTSDVLRLSRKMLEI